MYMNNCKECGVETPNPKFCSRSCSAKSTNRRTPKRKITKQCTKEGCSNVVWKTGRKLCQEHREEWLAKRDVSNKTLGEYKEMLSLKGKHLSWAFSHVRGLNRITNKHLSALPCANCGYDKHVHLHHIKPLSEFPDSATIAEVNSPSNNIQLCPNCHWEADNGLLDVHKIKEHIF